MENDAISRAWLLEQLQDLGNTTLLKRNFIALVENAPAVDDVKIVRCQNCKWFRKNNENQGYCLTPFGLDDPEEYDFCSHWREAEHG